MQFQCSFVYKVSQIVVVYALTFSFNMVLDNLDNRPTFDLGKKKKLHFRGNFSSKMVTFSVRNTNVYKIWKLYNAIFQYFATFRHQTLQFYQARINSLGGLGPRLGGGPLNVLLSF